MSDSYQETKQAPEKSVMGLKNTAERPRRITLREHIAGEIDHHLAKIEWLRRQAGDTPANLLDSCLEDVRHASRLV